MKRLKIEAPLALLLACLSLLVTACQSPPEPMPEPPAPAPPPAPPPEPAEPTAPPEQPLSTLGRDIMPDVQPELIAMLASDNTCLAFDIYQALRRQQGEGNVLFSPYGIGLTVALAYAGARGSTAEQMAEALHYNLPQEELHTAFNALDLNLKAAQNEMFQFSTIGVLWGDFRHRFRQEFADTLARHYGVEMRLIDFGDPETPDLINQWIAQETEGSIKQLFEQFASNTILVGANAVSLNARWAMPFPFSDRDGLFSDLNDTNVAVQMMHNSGNYRYATGDGYMVIEIPYANERMDMMVVVPDAQRFREIEERLDCALYMQMRDSLEPTVLFLEFPKFRVDFEVDLASLLSSMGMAEPFGDGANFSGIGDSISLMHAVHTASISVDDGGTEAYAGSGFGAITSASSIHLTVGRPFFYFVQDRETGALLFMGRLSQFEDQR